MSIESIEAGILSTIGNTPLIELKKIFSETSSVFHAKLEMFNPGGSTKDRTAFLMIYKALAEGDINHETTVVESSSGNMAIGLAQICRYLNLKLIIVTDPNINRHTRDLIRAYGAHIECVSNADTSGNFLMSRLKRVRELQESLPDCFWPNQYENALNPRAHYQTMKEIIDLLPAPPDYILVATSTCGTIMGCANYVHEHNLNTKIVAVDAVGSRIFCTTGSKRRIPGHGAGKPSMLLDSSLIDHIFHITDKECVIGCRKLLHRESILAGGSTGAVVIAAERMQSLVPENSSFVLIFPDSGERYLQTIYSDSWVKKTLGSIEESLSTDSAKTVAYASISTSNTEKSRLRSRNGAV